jgi:hypothetical protein
VEGFWEQNMLASKRRLWEAVEQGKQPSSDCAKSGEHIIGLFQFAIFCGK